MYLFIKLKQWKKKHENHKNWTKKKDRNNHLNGDIKLQELFYLSIRKLNSHLVETSQLIL